MGMFSCPQASRLNADVRPRFLQGQYAVLDTMVHKMKDNNFPQKQLKSIQKTNCGLHPLQRSDKITTLIKDTNIYRPPKNLINRKKNVITRERHQTFRYCLKIMFLFKLILHIYIQLPSLC